MNNKNTHKIKKIKNTKYISNNILDPTASFEDLAKDTSIFSPLYTEEFKIYIEKSIEQSRINEACAIESASKIII